MCKKHNFYHKKELDSVTVGRRICKKKNEAFGNWTCVIEFQRLCSGYLQRDTVSCGKRQRLMSFVTTATTVGRVFRIINIPVMWWPKFGSDLGPVPTFSELRGLRTTLRRLDASPQLHNFTRSTTLQHNFIILVQNTWYFFYILLLRKRKNDSVRNRPQIVEEQSYSQVFVKPCQRLILRTHLGRRRRTR